MPTVIQSSSCEIFIGDDIFTEVEKFILDHYSGRKLFVLADEHTKEKCLHLISGNVPALKDATILEMESGEKNKSLASCEKLWQQLTVHGASRKSLLVNVGGGMVGDVGGFVASTFMRGISFINIPTTLLAMVDASAGGKNGINFSGLKNQVGTFNQPAAVFISPLFLETLPERELKSGFAEVIKQVLIADKKKWSELKLLESLTVVDWLKLITDAVHIKNNIVSADFKERNKRKALNFGHTIGHAIESYSLTHDADPLKHGEAVAIGMIGSIFLSQKLLGFPHTDAMEIISFIQKQYGHLSPGGDAGEILELLHADKKNENQQANFVLLRNVGCPVIDQKVSDGLTVEAIEFSYRQIKATVHQSG